MPNLLQITPFMHVRELEPAILFFRDLLGFNVAFRSHNYAYVDREQVAVRIFQHDDEFLLPGNRGFRYYIDVKDLDALLAEMKPKLDKLPPGDVLGPVDQPYGQRELMILAPDGDLLVFGQAIGPDTSSSPT